MVIPAVPLEEGGLLAARGALTLFHGTDAASAASILENGLSLARATELGGGDALWSTTALQDARIFANVNPAGGSAAVLQIQLSRQLAQSLSADGLLTIAGPVHRFAPEAWETLNELATFSLVK